MSTPIEPFIYGIISFAVALACGVFAAMINYNFVFVMFIFGLVALVLFTTAMYMYSTEATDAQRRDGRWKDERGK
jgi:uncharacterized membrane protein